MIGLDRWAAEANFPDRPWLIVGKGPTFQRRSDFDLTGFNTVSLNHVVAELPVDVAHIMDIDVVAACSDALRTNCRYLVMPRRPHVACEPSHYLLEDFFDALPVLRELDAEGRLIWYSTSTHPVPGAVHHVRVRYFSSEAALGVVGALGGTDVRTLGIDGGRNYGHAFAHLNAVTKLANGQPSFDLQFAELESIRRRIGITVEPLVPALRVFVGAAERDLPAVRTLAHSISKHSTVPVRVTPMTDVRAPRPRARRNRPRTPFSFARFAIPELCGHEGRALYLDSDMLVLGDIAELATLPFDGAHLMCSSQSVAPVAWQRSGWFHPGRQFSVMALDCGRLDWDLAAIVAGLDEGRFTYDELLFEMCIVPQDRIADAVPPEWNHLERFEPGVTKLLHYTVVPQQPWRSDDNPLGRLWELAYSEAVRDGAVPWDEVDALVRSGEVKRSLAVAFEQAPRERLVSEDEILARELRAVRAQLEDVRRRTVRGRIHDRLRVGAPFVRRLAERCPGSRASAGAEWLQELVKGKR